MLWLSLIGNLFAAVTAVLGRRLRHGPARPSWSWADEMRVETVRRLSPFHKARRLEGAALAGILRRARQGMDALAGLLPLPADVTTEQVAVGPVPATWFRPGSGARSPVVLYLHGGAYTLGSPRSHRSFLAILVRATGLPVLAPDYRLAPEHPCPAALDDALACYRWLADTFGAKRIAVAGESAGGGLALALLLALRREKLPMPACGVLISPWADLGVDADEKRLDTGVDLLRAGELEPMARLYAAGMDRGDTRLSPVMADLSGLPPLLILAGGAELLLADSQRVALRAREDGVDVTLAVEADEIHAYPLLSSAGPRGAAAIRRMKDFMAARLTPP